MAFGYLGSSPTNAPSLAESDVIAGAGLPIKVGSRSVAFVITPRVGAAAGRISLHGGDGFQPAFAWGGDLGVTPFRYHLSGLVGYLRAAGPSGGAVGAGIEIGDLRLSAPVDMGKASPNCGVSSCNVGTISG